MWALNIKFILFNFFIAILIKVNNIEISQIDLNIEYLIIYMYWIWYIFVRNYDFIHMIMDNLTMNWFWYPNQWGLFIGALRPSQWGLFIGALIPKPMGVIHWYSDTQPMGVIHWYSDAQSRGYSVTIVIRSLRIWITFEYVNYMSY